MNIIDKKHSEIIKPFEFNGISEEFELINTENIKIIAENAFRYKNIKKLLNLPKLSGIDKAAFADCDIEKIDLTNVETISANAFYSSDLINVKADNLKFLGPQAFTYSKIETFSSKTISVIPKKCFMFCNSLKKVEIPNVREIHNNAFAYCENLEEIVLPKTLTYLGAGAFRDCENLKCVVFNEIPSKRCAASFEEIIIEVFDGCNSLNKIVIPKDFPKFYPEFCNIFKDKIMFNTSLDFLLEEGKNFKEINSVYKENFSR